MKKILSTIIVLTLLISCKQQTEAPEPDSSHKEMLEKYIEVWNTNDSEILSAVMADNFKRYGNGELEASGTFELATLLNTWHTATPDMEIAISDATFVDDKAFFYWTAEGTNTGNFGDMPPTGKRSTTKGFSVVSFNDERKIVKEESFFDLANIYEDWGYEITLPTEETED